MFFGMPKKFSCEVEPNSFLNCSSSLKGFLVLLCLYISFVCLSSLILCLIKKVFIRKILREFFMGLRELRELANLSESLRDVTDSVLGISRY